uniref:Uncharacterized protein n=1 Tax=Callorhinchus milii TaxID=7868 RepID=A0A4W3IFC9_CALMI
ATKLFFRRDYYPRKTDPLINKQPGSYLLLGKQRLVCGVRTCVSISERPRWGSKKRENVAEVGVCVRIGISIHFLEHVHITQTMHIECTLTGFVEEIKCVSDQRYRSCHSVEMEELKFWKFEGVMFLVGIVFSIIVVFRQRILDRRAEKKVLQQLGVI